MSPCVGRTSAGFRHRVARRLLRRQPQRGLDGTWEYPPLEEAMAEAGMQYVETYVSHCHNTVAQYIATRLIMDLFLLAERRLGTRLSKRWWDQEGLGL